jgi:putative spermidine/putrescine transport system permease protein
MSAPTLSETAPLPALPRRGPRRLAQVGLLAAPATAYLLLAYALPLVLLLFNSIRSKDGLSLAQYVAFFADPFSWRVIGNTVKIASLTTLAALLLGYPVAFALARSRGALQGLLLVALILPLSVGVVVKAFSWQILLKQNGVVNQALIGLGLTDAPVRLLFTETGLVFGAVNVFLPLMVLPIYSVVKLIDARLYDAAATLGSSPLHRFLTVALPLSLPGIIAGVAFVFSMAISMYVIPSLLIGDRYQTLATLTGRSFLFLRNEALGSTTAVVLLVIALAVVVGSSLLMRRSAAR